MVSQCVKNDTIVQLSCPVIGFDENYYFIYWFSETGELNYDYDNVENAFIVSTLHVRGKD